MKFDLTPDHPVTDAECKKASGKTFKEWFAWLDKKWPEQPKRRVVVYTIYDNEFKDIWWATTIGVEYERHTLGLFARDLWLSLLREAGFHPTVVPLEHSDMAPGSQALFIATRPAT